MSQPCKDNDTLFWVVVIVFLVSVMLSNESDADTTVYLGAWSKHRYDKPAAGEPEYNETHDLIALKHESVFLGRFRNSYDKESWLVLQTWQWQVHPHIALGIGLGGVSGYDTCPLGNPGGLLDICLAIVPTVTYNRYNLEANIIGIPGGIAVGPSWRF